MFSRGPGIGLDIGSKKIKMARVRKAGRQVQLVKFGSMAAPEGAIEAGIILDADLLGRCIRELVREMDLEGKSVVSAVSGQQIYIRSLVMPRMKAGELKAAAMFQAAGFLPIPVEEAAIDVFPFRHFEDDEGKKTEVFFVAARRQQVEALEEVCRYAGLKLAVAEIEPLAVHRVMERPEDAKTVGVLNIGASRSHFSVFKRGLLTSLRSLSFGCSAFYQDLRGISREENMGLENIDVGEGNQHSYLVRDIMSELARSVEYYELQNEGEIIDTVLLCGGGSRLKNLDTYLASGLGRKVGNLEYMPGLILPADIPPEQQGELRHDFAVALGLAMREVR